MPPKVIRPSLKLIKAGYAAAAALFVGALIAHFAFLADRNPVPWLPIAAALTVLWPIERHIRRQSVKITVSGDKLRYESGFLSTSTRLIPLPKIQDVRVNQTLLQRMLDIGNVAIETAGEASRLTLRNVDRPHAVAEEILEASGGAGAAKQAL